MSEPTKTRDAELIQILRRAAFFSRNGNGAPAVVDAFEMLAEKFELEEDLKAAKALEKAKEVLDFIAQDTDEQDTKSRCIAALDDIAEEELKQKCADSESKKDGIQ